MIRQNSTNSDDWKSISEVMPPSVNVRVYEVADFLCSASVNRTIGRDDRVECEIADLLARSIEEDSRMRSDIREISFIHTNTLAVRPISTKPRAKCAGTS
jgi:hypothetical protein